MCKGNKKKRYKINRKSIHVHKILQSNVLGSVLWQPRQYLVLERSSQNKAVSSSTFRSLFTTWPFFVAISPKAFTQYFPWENDSRGKGGGEIGWQCIIHIVAQHPVTPTQPLWAEETGRSEESRWRERNRGDENISLQMLHTVCPVAKEREEGWRVQMDGWMRRRTRKSVEVWCAVTRAL